ncbi:hypothetical protein [Uliginosibacterium sp. TH139]|uniref:hypothetical protein n=1 Tax=Uliginosibacterium sp. TH139 TaxID=2067453 RepID=UPI000C7B7CCA|nr:hypothetical protein [Uliginosibacterium sp. TH139]PLK50524.1 hypothetical protein C0V76_01495 [Uliginosibacterium sp. TH139]
MKLASLSSGYESAFHSYCEAGGCLDFFALELDQADSQLETLILHRNAVKLVTDSIERDQVECLEQLWAKGQITRENKELALFEFDLAKAQPELISLEKFLGSHFDLVARKLIVRGTQKPNLNRYFLAGFEEANVFERFPRHGGEFNCDGYAGCFAEPPHSIGATTSALEEWFELINAELFGGLNRQLEIFSWGHDWSNYFDAGKEWWGAYFWSVHNPSLQRLAVIGASTTD